MAGSLSHEREFVIPPDGDPFDSPSPSPQVPYPRIDWPPDSGYYFFDFHAWMRRFKRRWEEAEKEADEIAKQLGRVIDHLREKAKDIPAAVKERERTLGRGQKEGWRRELALRTVYEKLNAINDIIKAGKFDAWKADMQVAAKAAASMMDPVMRHYFSQVLDETARCFRDWNEMFSRMSPYVHAHPPKTKAEKAFDRAFRVYNES